MARRRHRRVHHNRRRRHHRNPFSLFGRHRRNPPGIKSLTRPLMWGAAGLATAKFVSSTVTPMVGATVTSSVPMRIAWGLGMAYVGAWVLEMLGGDFQAAFIGGAMSPAQDFITNYVTPIVPQISAYSSNVVPMRRGMSGNMGVYSVGPSRAPTTFDMTAG